MESLTALANSASSILKIALLNVTCYANYSK
jgi:hypothetical protein